MDGRTDKQPAATQSFDATTAYLELLKLCLNGLTAPPSFLRRPERLRVGFGPRESRGQDAQIGEGWPANGYTMIGIERTENLQACVEEVLSDDVPGDMIEAGVWRGGATILMRALLKVNGVTDRTVVVADSFEGVPPPDEEAFPADANSRLHTRGHLVVPVDQVKENFARFGLLDDQVEFLEGWFRDTLPTLENRVWSVVRLDGDLYESTMNGLENLYPNLSRGGYLIVDDYGGIAKCREAVHDYREANGIDEEIRKIDWSGVFWRKES
jgi:hypothetical protein